MAIIATVKLEQGEVGFYDPLTRMHLTIAKPLSPVYDHWDLKTIRSAVHNRRLRLINGTLTVDKVPTPPKSVDTQPTTITTSEMQEQIIALLKKEREEELIAQAIKAEQEVNAEQPPAPQQDEPPVEDNEFEVERHAIKVDIVEPEVEEVPELVVDETAEVVEATEEQSEEVVKRRGRKPKEQL